MQFLRDMFHFETSAEFWWVMIGLLGQLSFTARFVVQWIASERAGRSVIPMAFWFFSLGGGLTLFVYAIYRQDPVFTLGQSLGLFIYGRNIWMIRADGRANKASSSLDGNEGETRKVSN